MTLGGAYSIHWTWMDMGGAISGEIYHETVMGEKAGIEWGGRMSEEERGSGCESEGRLREGKWMSVVFADVFNEI